jgi:hypothetical protein
MVKHPTHGIGKLIEDRGETVIVEFDKHDIWQNSNVLEVSKSMIQVIGEKKSGSRWER